MSELAANTMESNPPPAEIDTSAPAPEAARASDYADQDAAEARAEAETKQLLGEGIKVIAEYGDHDEYRAERAAQRALKNSDDAFLARDAPARAERWGPILENLSQATADAVGAPFSVEDRIAWEKCQLRAEFAEKQSPGFTERVNQVTQVYGPLQGAAYRAAVQSPHINELTELIVENPQWIATLNNMTPHQAEIAIARLEERAIAANADYGYGGGYGYQAPPPPPQPKIVSSAPAPIETVGGKAGAAGKHPEEMSNDEYRRWRTAQMKAKRG